MWNFRYVKEDKKKSNLPLTMNIATGRSFVKILTCKKGDDIHGKMAQYILKDGQLTRVCFFYSRAVKNGF